MRGLQTLHDFLSSPGRLNFPKNAYVKAPGFKQLYVRYGRRYLNGVFINGVLDLANIEASRPGKGAFTALATRLLKRGIPLYVECVMNERFVKKLEDIGFTRIPNDGGAPSFFKLPEEQSS